MKIIKGYSYCFQMLMLSLVSPACIDTVDLDLNRSSDLVIDGLITDKDQPYIIKIYRYDLESNQKLGVEGAEVIISDDANNVEHLTDQSFGNYVTSDDGIKGVVGRSYTLEVILENGERYISEPELLKPNIGLDSIYWREGVSRVVSDQGNVIERDNVSIYINSNPLQQSSNFFRWRYTDIYEFVTQPELRTLVDPTRPDVEMPDPPPCSGYVVYVDNPSSIIQVDDDCSCCVCYVTELSDDVIVSDGRFLSGFFEEVKIATFKLDERFRQRFYVEVEQLSLSDRAHEFWTLIANQRDNNSSVFSTPPAKIPSNISAIDNPDEVVLGYFGASAVKTISIAINWFELEGFVPPIPIYTEDCRFRDNSVNEKPEFW